MVSDANTVMLVKRGGGGEKKEEGRKKLLLHYLIYIASFIPCLAAVIWQLSLCGSCCLCNPSDSRDLSLKLFLSLSALVTAALPGKQEKPFVMNYQSPYMIHSIFVLLLFFFLFIALDSSAPSQKFL